MKRKDEWEITEIIDQLRSAKGGETLNINLGHFENHPPSFNMWFFMELGTPLHSAARDGKAQVAAYLLKHGASPLVKDTKDRTPLDYAKASGNVEMIEMLEYKKDPAKVLVQSKI